MTQSDDAVTSLRAAGWSPGRSVDIQGATEALHRAGYKVWPALEEFLREYDGLTVTFERKGFPDSAEITARGAATGLELPTVMDYESWVGARLAPIGYAYRSHLLLLLLSDDGRFFGGYDAYLTELGTSPIELMENLIAEDGRRVHGGEPSGGPEGG